MSIVTAEEFPYGLVCAECHDEIDNGETYHAAPTEDQMVQKLLCTDCAKEQQA